MCALKEHKPDDTNIQILTYDIISPDKCQDAEQAPDSSYHPSSGRSHGSSGRPLPEQQSPVFAAGCCPPLSAGYGLCGDRPGDAQRRPQRPARGLLHGGVVLLLRHVGAAVLPGCHASSQLPPCVLGQPHCHVRGPRHPPVSSGVRRPGGQDANE